MVVSANLADFLGRERERADADPHQLPDRPAASRALAQDLGVGVLFDRLLDAVVVATLSEGRIVLWNAAAEKLFGYTADQAIGQLIDILMPQAIASVHRAGFERYLRTGHGLIVDADGPVEMPARTCAGDEIRVELTLSELTNTRGERFAVAIVRDAMRRKQLELTTLELVQARVAQSETESLLAARDELIDAILASLEGESDPDAVRRLFAIVAQLRRVERGEPQLQLMEKDLVDVVHAASDAARRRASARRIAVHTPPSAPTMCDPTYTRQALDLLLDEAIRASQNGARIEVRIDLPSGQVVQVTLRAEASSEGDRPAPGPGLQLGRTLLQRQGGTFAATHSASDGLELVFTLPASSQPARSALTRRVRRAPSLPCYR